MLLRDIKLEPRSKGNEYWLSARFTLADGTGRLTVQKSTAAYTDSPHRWWIFLNTETTAKPAYSDMDEFEAQAVLDHYVFNIGIKP